uniref:ATP synthase F0 subunit 8 n=1 Tax=Conidiobolus taihushanensis TaxID=2721185 RepID=UPI001D1238D6|nr:ATP synthase F0 subunit 8 [Conidiobolus taihushanensis]QZZ81391.1 ATP synthase F0 subunit 8 [Conidiobolus taihushanensis]
MPQLIPIYFVNQVSFLYLILIILIVLVSKVFLPRIPRLSLVRKALTEGSIKK